MPGNLAVFGAVGFIIGIQQVQVRTAHRHFPDTGGQGTAGEGHRGRDPVAGRVQHRLGRNLQEVLSIVPGHLVAVGGQNLRKVAETVQKSHRHQVYIHVAGFLEIVTGEDPQAAGVDFQGCIQAVFHAEIGDGRGGPFRLGGHVGVEFGKDGVHLLQEGLVR